MAGTYKLLQHIHCIWDIDQCSRNRSVFGISISVRDIHQCSKYRSSTVGHSSTLDGNTKNEHPQHGNNCTVLLMPNVD